MYTVVLTEMLASEGRGVKNSTFYCGLAILSVVAMIIYLLFAYLFVEIYLLGERSEPHTKEYNLNRDIPCMRIYIYLYICDSTWEKGPSRALFQNRVIATAGKSRLLATKCAT